MIRIVRRLSPGFARRRITRRTRLHQDLGWDEWYALRVVAPIRRTLHEEIEDRLVLRSRTVGELVALVWGALELPA